MIGCLGLYGPLCTLTYLQCGIIFPLLMLQVTDSFMIWILGGCWHEFTIRLDDGSRCWPLSISRFQSPDWYYLKATLKIKLVVSFRKKIGIVLGFPIMGFAIISDYYSSQRDFCVFLKNKFMYLVFLQEIMNSWICWLRLFTCRWHICIFNSLMGCEQILLKTYLDVQFIFIMNVAW